LNRNLPQGLNKLIMKVALASPPHPASLNECLKWIETLVKDAARAGADIICFPESYLPGYPLEELKPEACTDGQLRAALDQVCGLAKEHAIAVILPMDWYEQGAFLNVAQVISKTGRKLGYQTKNQLDPSEDHIWQAGTERRLFEVEGVKFGITICHEGFRYPESVRWAAQQGAKLVFHPNFTADLKGNKTLKEWGHHENPYYEKAQMMRAMENTIYFAPSNYMHPYSESASSVIAPDGTCIAYQKYEEPGIAVAEIDPAQATGLLAKRFKGHLYASS
jgi:predicted amidohydrolase